MVDVLHTSPEHSFMLIARFRDFDQKYLLRTPYLLRYDTSAFIHFLFFSFLLPSSILRISFFIF